MNQATAKIDANEKATLTAYDETTLAPEAVCCDAVLDYLEIYIAGSGSGTYTALNRALIDENDNATLLGYNDTTGELEALRCDSSNNLLVTLV